MIQKALSASIGVIVFTIIIAESNQAPAMEGENVAPATSSRQAKQLAKKTTKGIFEPTTYLAELSAEATQLGYREFAYKETPEGELRIYFKMPAGWSVTDKRPVMIFFFGGGWSGGSPFACVKEADHFTKSGIVVGLADYRVRNRQVTMLDKCAEDARSAVRWVRANREKLGADPDRLIVGGGSAGGHIAACTANANAPNSNTDDVSISCAPNALLLYYPVASLVDGSRSFAFKRLLGDDLAMKLSPVQNATQAWPKTVMFSGTADIELANGIIDKESTREVLSGNLKKYNSELVADIAGSPDLNASRLRRQRGVATESVLVPASKSTPTPIPETQKATDLSASGLQPLLGKKGSLLLNETFDSNELSKGWTGKTGGLKIADGSLHASQNRSDGRLGLFSREQPMQDAAIEIDFKFTGARGINISCNPSPGELRKHGHLFSVMITQRMWNITEHNDKSDPNSRSKALATASTNFESGRWYKLLLEFKGDEVIARVEGKEPLRASSSDFRVKKPGIEFRVSGSDGEKILLDNLKVWELQ